MSGPKTSRYTLTPEQRRILEEQQKIERRKAIAAENIKKGSKRIHQIDKMFSSDKKVASELLNRIGTDGGFGQKLSELQSLTDPIEQMIAKTDMDDVGTLENTAAVVGEFLAKTEKLVHEIMEIASKNEYTLRSDLEAAIDQGFSTSFADIKTREITSVSDRKEKIYSQLTQMQKNSILPIEYANELEAALKGIDDITDEVFLKNYSALTVAPLIKKCNSFLTEYSQYHEEFENLYTEYKALCGLYYFVPQEYVCCAEAIATLKSEIQRIKEMASEEDEQSYINECLDEVMEEMGYSILGSYEVTKKNGKHFRNELYTYGKGTAVNITYSPNGRIAMELGGMDTSDRLPDERETSILCNAMDEFCEDFKEIEKRLAAKGVVLDERISLLPPDAEYAQIINTLEYEMQAEVEKIQSKKQRRAAMKLKSKKE